MLGPRSSDTCFSERWKAYDWWPLRYRQLCWAHLKRQFQAFVEVGGASARLGAALLEQTERLFALGYRVRDATLKRSSLRVYVSAIRREVRRLLEQGARCRRRQRAGRCAAILAVESALWTFVRVEGLEPTNNGSERTLRHGVIWRKLCFGTHSVGGSRFVERMLTVRASLQQQERNILDYVTGSVIAAQKGEAPLLLLPQRA